jgi:hypothetical protein
VGAAFGLRSVPGSGVVGAELLTPVSRAIPPEIARRSGSCWWWAGSRCPAAVGCCPRLFAAIVARVIGANVCYAHALLRVAVVGPFDVPAAGRGRPGRGWRCCCRSRGACGCWCWDGRGWRRCYWSGKACGCWRWSGSRWRWGSCRWRWSGSRWRWGSCRWRWSGSRWRWGSCRWCRAGCRWRWASCRWNWLRHPASPALGAS